MKTYLHIKSGHRYPEHGVASSFSQSTKRDGSLKPLEHHIKPGYPECTNGWKKLKIKEWKVEEIPDLKKPYTREEWLAYAEQYGDMCAMEFLETCDYMKPRVAYQMHHPPKNEAEWDDPELQKSFRGIFGVNMNQFIDGYMLGLGNTYSFDVLKFESHLRGFTDYRGQDISMSAYIKQRYGVAAERLVRYLISFNKPPGERLEQTLKMCDELLTENENTTDSPPI